MNEQMLALLVMDLGYTSEPLYGHAPIRHQIAWKMCADELGDKLQEEVDKMAKQESLEKNSMAKSIASQIENSNSGGPYE